MEIICFYFNRQSSGRANFNHANSHFIYNEMSLNLYHLVVITVQGAQSSVLSLIHKAQNIFFSLHKHNALIFYPTQKKEKRINVFDFVPNP